ncbi:MAG: peptidoglycan bridge formation glycyltransferase FemA/FemB family protein [Patescibacteria group bacterium]
MAIIQVGDEFKQHWDSFVKSNAADGGLLQSWQWGDFQKSLDNRIFRLGVINEEGQLQAAALLIKHELPFEYNYLYCPRGPVINSLRRQDLSALFTEIKKIAKVEKSFLLRVDPPWLMGNEKLLTDAGFRKGEYEIQPKCSLVIDISKSEEEILAQMKQKTRYNIGLAQRHGVKVRISSELSDVESFWQLTKQTSTRDGFSPHPKEHYKKMFEILSQEGSVKLFIAEYENKVIGVNMVSFFSQVCTYLHGSSSDMYREVMATYLLQWQAILEAKKLGYKFYDFGGINGKTFNNPKWKGITRFKTSFAPELLPREYVGSFDLILNPIVFSIYKFVKQIRG